MNLEGYLLKLIKEIEKEEYKVYVVGKAVWLSLLGRPIEEYTLVTSAPLFSCSKQHKPFAVKDYPCKIFIYYETELEDYYSICNFTIDTLCYHWRYGILDKQLALKDFEKRMLCSIQLPKKAIQSNPVYILKAIGIAHQYGFTLEPRLKAALKQVDSSVLRDNSTKLFPDLLDLLSLDKAGSVLQEYENVFSGLIPLQKRNLALMDILKNDIVLRLVALFYGNSIKWVEGFPFPSPLKNRVLYLLDILSEPFRQGHLKTEEDITDCFAIKRAIELVEGRFSSIAQLDELEKKWKKELSIKASISLEELMIQKEDLRWLGYNEKAIPNALRLLHQMVLKRQIENKKEVLLYFATQMHSKNFDDCS